MKNKYINFIIVALSSLALVSCLKKDLPQMTSSGLNDISDFNLYYKYVDTIVDNKGTPQENTRIQVETVQLSRTKTISNDTVYVTPGFPAGFPRNEKPKVTLGKIWGYANIPEAAIIAPVGSSPALGRPGDFTKPAEYEVTAANGNKKKWVVVVTPLPVVNAWEGTYLESGTLNHASAGLQTCPVGFTQDLITVSATKLKATAGFWYFNNSGITYFINVNADNTVTISSDPDAVVAIQQETPPASTYDPVNKRFTLYYYYYSGGNPANWRRFNTVLTLK